MNNLLSVLDKILDLFYTPYAIEILILVIISFIETYKKKKIYLLLFVLYFFVIIGWRCYLGITSKRYLSFILILATFSFVVLVYNVSQNKYVSRLIVIITCILLLTKTFSYNPFCHWYKHTAKSIVKELDQSKNTKIISFLDEKKNKKITFGNNLSIEEYQFFTKTTRLHYMNSCLLLLVSNLFSKDVDYLIMLEGYPNEEIPSIPGLSLIDSTFINRKRKSKIYLFSFKPTNDFELTGESHFFLYNETFENKTEETFFKNWHEIKTKTNSISLDTSASFFGNKSLRISAPDFLSYFSNYNMYKRINKDLTYSFVSSGPPGGVLSVYFGFWTNPTDNIVSFQIYSHKYVSRDIVEHKLVIPSYVCNQENYFNLFFSVDNGLYFIDNISLSY